MAKTCIVHGCERRGVPYCLSHRRHAAKLIEYDGKVMTVERWAKHLGMSKNTLDDRLNVLGWSIERALTEPVRKYGGVSKNFSTSLGTGVRGVAQG